MKTPAEIYEVFEQGEHLTDQELEVGIAHFRCLGELALSSGLPFKLAGLAAIHIADGLGRYQLARQQNRWR